MTHRYDLTVRGYELDSFGHVNNAVYLNYIEQARWEIVREKGLLDYFATSGNFPVVVDVHVRYVLEAMVFDRLTILSELHRKPPYLVFTHKIIRADDGRAVARATVKMIIIDRERVPQDIPSFFTED